jgi:transposase-like protein
MSVPVIKIVRESAGARRASALSRTEPVDSVSKVAVVLDPEVSERPVRRSFTAEYKLSILHQVKTCTDQGGVGALLRREGLYSSNLTKWKRQLDEGILVALTPKQRGRKAAEPDPLVAENRELHKDNDRLTKRLKQAELLIDIQKKISQIIGITLETPPENGSDS